jgi:hypothetical protein
MYPIILYTDMNWNINTLALYLSSDLEIFELCRNIVELYQKQNTASLSTFYVLSYTEMGKSIYLSTSRVYPLAY